MKVVNKVKTTLKRFVGKILGPNLFIIVCIMGPLGWVFWLSSGGMGDSGLVFFDMEYDQFLEIEEKVDIWKEIFWDSIKKNPLYKKELEDQVLVNLGSSDIVAQERIMLEKLKTKEAIVMYAQFCGDVWVTVNIKYPIFLDAFTNNVSPSIYPNPMPKGFGYYFFSPKRIEEVFYTLVTLETKEAIVDYGLRIGKDFQVQRNRIKLFIEVLLFIVHFLVALALRTERVSFFWKVYPLNLLLLYLLWRWF